MNSGSLVASGSDATFDAILSASVLASAIIYLFTGLSLEAYVGAVISVIIIKSGIGKNLASVHLELPDTMTVKEVDKLTRKAEARVYKETGVILTGVGVYSYNTGDTEAARIQNDVLQRVMAHDWTLQMHGFYLDTETKEMQFDVVMSFDIKPREGVKIICDEIREVYPEYSISVAPDVDISD